MTRRIWTIGSLLFLAVAASAQASRPTTPAAAPRARDLGIPFNGDPGALNAITDIAGVEVGHVTLISGDGPLVRGKGPVRTGVTAVLPRGRQDDGPCFAGWWSLNGNGEMTGTTWVEESGCLETPVLLTNTHSVGVVRDAVIEWKVARGADPGGYYWSLPVVAETWDGSLNDINGFHVKREHVFSVLEDARAGPVAEGNVGGGTGMICHEFKGGIGTASRRVTRGSPHHTVGVLVQANHGLRRQLVVAGIPIGEHLPIERPRRRENGSIIVVIATDAPLLPHQLKRLAKRAALGQTRSGSVGGDGSGDIYVAFSTANRPTPASTGVATATFLANHRLDPLFEAVVQAVDEAIINALVAARTMVGIDDTEIQAIPHDRLVDILRRHDRLESAK